MNLTLFIVCHLVAEYRTHNLNHVFCHRALKFCGPGGPLHVKLVIEWENRIKEW